MLYVKRLLNIQQNSNIAPPLHNITSSSFSAMKVCKQKFTPVQYFNMPPQFSMTSGAMPEFEYICTSKYKDTALFKLK